MKQQTLFLELNEISFEFVEKYCARGLLPNFAKILAKHGYAKTSSETQYHELEPWIQWVSAHTGLTLREHNVFRLGDIEHKDLKQIWETLEDQGLKVGAISPMNAKHRLRSPAFFVPDPWTKTAVSGPRVLKGLYGAVAQAVNDNAQARVSPRSLAGLVAGLAAYARPTSYRHYVELLLHARTRPWNRALILDQLLADVFLREVSRTRPDFASLFLNAGAHVQHHYLFSSAAYEGPLSNPEWYVPPGSDPVRDVYQAYDRIVGAVQTAFPSARLLIATGLRQVPHPEVTYYWRLRNHGRFLRNLGVRFTRVEPRMSRDFLVTCDSAGAAKDAATILNSVKAQDGLSFFEVDNRGTDLFVMLTYPRQIEGGFVLNVGHRVLRDVDREVVFVAIKNGQHDGMGYFIDTAKREGELPACIPITDLPRLTAEACGVKYSQPAAAVSTACAE